MEESISRLMKQAIEAHVFPGAVVGWIQDDSLNILPFGHATYENDSPKIQADSVYDLASITKAVPTNTLAIKLIEQGRLREDDKVIDYIPELQNQYREEVLIHHLLTFTVIFDFPGRLSSYAERGPDAVLDMLFTSELTNPPGQKYEYQNAAIILLTVVIERITGKSLDVLADELLFKPLEMSHTSFYPESLQNVLIPPTEINTRGLVQGVVHDETAAAFHKEKRIAGHAGLFSNAQDLLTFGRMLMNDGTINGKVILSPESVKKIKTEVINDGQFGMTPGWETNQHDYMSSRLSPLIYGKDGFTGTLMLVDPVKHRCLVMLSNCTFPKRPLDREPIKRVQRELAEIVLS